MIPNTLHITHARSARRQRTYAQAPSPSSATVTRSLKPLEICAVDSSMLTDSAMSSRASGDAIAWTTPTMNCSKLIVLADPAASGRSREACQSGGQCCPVHQAACVWTASGRHDAYRRSAWRWPRRRRPSLRHDMKELLAIGDPLQNAFNGSAHMNRGQLKVHSAQSYQQDTCRPGRKCPRGGVNRQDMGEALTGQSGHFHHVGDGGLGD